MYNYETQRQFVFTEEGVKKLLETKDEALQLIADAGCVMSGKLFVGTGNSWDNMACWDYLIEIGVLREIKQQRTPVGQCRIFVKGGGQ